MVATEFQVDDLIDNRYRVLKVLGKGGMGTLCRVVDEARQGEVVALKMVQLDGPEAESSQRVERFRQEFQLLTQLRHPNLVEVYDYGVTVDGGLYFTMEWVEGHDLDVGPGRHPLEPAETVAVIVQICRALAYLHARGVIHGDLKPANVLLTGEKGRQVKIVDFGVALEVRLTQSHRPYYTPGYSAPEVRRREMVDAQADLYSLGALWYALLVGEPPMFMISPQRLIRATLREVLTGQDQLPLAIGHVITRLLAETPDDRYAGANGVIEAVNVVTNRSYVLETRETASSYALLGRFVGRESEMGMLQTAWEQALTGEGELVLVSGETGVGKTRLVEEFGVRVATAGARVVRCQCVARGGGAYRLWREILRPLLRHLEAAEEPALDMEWVGPVLAPVLPELRRRDDVTGLPAPAELPPQAAQQRLHDAILRVLRAAARLRPTLVVIEDAHWADEATLGLLGRLARIPWTAPLLVCVTYCGDDVAADHPLERLEGDRVGRLNLGPLSPDLIEELVSSMLGLEELPALLIEQVQRATGGNAFFVQELIRSLAEDGEVLQRTVKGWRVDYAALQEARLPESIRQTVWRRVAHLEGRTRHVLQRAAVAGPLFWDGLVEAIGRLTEDQVCAALADGMEHELIVERDAAGFSEQREFAFATSTVERVCYESLPREKRRQIHGRIAAWLVDRDEQEVDEHLDLIAHHLEQAGQSNEALGYLHRAGEQAAAQFSNIEAIEYFSQALDLVQPEDLDTQYALLIARQAVYHLLGRREEQDRDLCTLERLVEGLTDDRWRAEVAYRRSVYAAAIGDYVAAEKACRQTVAAARAAGDRGSEARGYVQWGLVLSNQGAWDVARTRLERGLALAEAGDYQTAADGLRELGGVSWRLGEYDAAQSYFERALEMHRRVGDRRGEAEVLNNLGIVYNDRGYPVQAITYYQQALDICSQIGDRLGQGRQFNNLGLLFHRLGDCATARSYYSRTLKNAREIGDRSIECTVLLNLALLSHTLGNDRVGREYSQQALRLSQDSGDRANRAYGLNVLGHTLAGLGLLDEAAGAYGRALDVRRELGSACAIMESLAGLVEISLERGELDPAQAWAEEILACLETDAPDGAEEPFRVYLACYRGLEANGDPRAVELLSTAYHLLQEWADRIADQDLRRSFLQNVAVHREIVCEWANRRVSE